MNVLWIAAPWAWVIVWGAIMLRRRLTTGRAARAKRRAAIASPEYVIDQEKIDRELSGG